MANISIPEAALEAGARAIQSVMLGPIMDAPSQAAARAAFIAMINAWPGMHIHEWQRPWLGGMSGSDLILPLTQQASDDPQKA